jgi:hypothetical protein
MKKLIPLILIISFSAGLFSGCKKDKGDPPGLPPLESMSIDFSNFISLKKGDALPGQKGTENSNWEFAAATAGFWNLILSTTLAIPVASFKLAIDQDPVYLESKTWQWSYSVPVAGTTYKARLTGQIGASDVKWKMYISGSFAEFLWFEGTSKLDGTGGQWILNESSQSQVSFLKIDWTKTSSSIGSITYTYLKNNSFKNSTIKYEMVSGTFDSKYAVYYFNGLKFSTVNIEWNKTGHDGRVMSADYLDGDWKCWNANKINQTCL